MTTRRLPPGPPRAIRKGDVVAAYCDELGEWSAAQVIALESREQAVNVLDLDWAGPEPERLEDLGELKPLRDPDVPGWAQYSRAWVLTRSHKILGNAPRLRTQRSGGYRSGGWRTGYELYRRRLRRGDPVDPRDPLQDQIGETRLHRMLSDPAFRNPQMLDLTITSDPVTGPDVACDRLVEAFPNLTRLTIWGVMGRLGNAAALHNLTSLRTVDLEEVFGMGAADRLDPAVMTNLEHIELRNVPADYATAMRRAWKPEVPKGVFLSITGARKPEWVAQNITTR